MTAPVALPIVNGPYDGGSWRSPDAFVEVDGLLYEFAELAGVGEAFVFCGYSAFRCKGCLAYITPPPDETLDECPFCGHVRAVKA